MNDYVVMFYDTTKQLYSKEDSERFTMELLKRINQQHSSIDQETLL